jgi:hypothetical protein
MSEACDVMNTMFSGSFEKSQSESTTISDVSPIQDLIKYCCEVIQL